MMIRTELITLNLLWLSCFTAVAEPMLELDSATVESGQSTTLNVSTADFDPAWAGINASVQLPSGVDLVSAASLLGSAYDFDYHYDAATNKVSLILFSETQSFGTTALDIASLEVLATQDAEIGPNPVVFVEGLSGISTVDGGESVAHSTIAGLLNILGAGLPIAAWPAAILVLIAAACRRHWWRDQRGSV